MLLLGGSGLAATLRKDAASMKSLNLTAAAVVALLASAFVWQVRPTFCPLTCSAIALWVAAAVNVYMAFNADFALMVCSMRCD